MKIYWVEHHGEEVQWIETNWKSSQTTFGIAKNFSRQPILALPEKIDLELQVMFESFQNYFLLPFRIKHFPIDSISILFVLVECDEEAKCQSHWEFKDEQAVDAFEAITISIL